MRAIHNSRSVNEDYKDPPVSFRDGLQDRDWETTVGAKPRELRCRRKLHCHAEKGCYDPCKITVVESGAARCVVQTSGGESKVRDKRGFRSNAASGLERAESE